MDVAFFILIDVDCSPINNLTISFLYFLTIVFYWHSEQVIPHHHLTGMRNESRRRLYLSCNMDSNLHYEYPSTISLSKSQRELHLAVQLSSSDFNIDCIYGLSRGLELGILAIFFIYDCVSNRGSDMELDNLLLHLLHPQHCMTRSFA